MPIITDLDGEHGVVIHRVAGRITFEEIRHEVEALFAEHPMRHSLWDLTGADLSEFQVGEVQLLLDSLAPLAQKRSEMGVRTAFSILQPVNYGICRIIDAVAEALPCERRVFYSYEEALAWLAEAASPGDQEDSGSDQASAKRPDGS
jgi:hypothetical protein